MFLAVKNFFVLNCMARQRKYSHLNHLAIAGMWISEESRAADFLDMYFPNHDCPGNQKSNGRIGTRSKVRKSEHVSVSRSCICHLGVSYSTRNAALQPVLIACALSAQGRMNLRLTSRHGANVIVFLNSGIQFWKLLKTILCSCAWNHVSRLDYD